MLRTRAPEVSLWETVLPDEVLRLPEELARVDAVGRSGILRADYAVLRPAGGPPVHADGGLPVLGDANRTEAPWGDE
jgi:hypothetical protein